MKDVIAYFGSAPIDEDCAMVSDSADYIPRMRAELRAYANQLTRMFPPPDGAAFRIVWHDHEFGRYGEVQALGDSRIQDHVMWAFNADDFAPLNWDEAALIELAEAGFPIPL